ncbi:hypothetical protein V6Z90_001853 [Aspergillus fumigatus]
MLLIFKTDNHVELATRTRSCDTLMLDTRSLNLTIPAMEIGRVKAWAWALRALQSTLSYRLRHTPEFVASSFSNLPRYWMSGFSSHSSGTGFHISQTLEVSSRP